MPKLRQKTTGEIYPFMPGLAARDDMEVIEDEAAEPTAANVVEAVKEKRAKKKMEDIEFKVEAAPTVVEAE